VDLHEVVPELQKADSSVIDMKEWRQHFEQQQNNGKTSKKDGSNTEESSESESQVRKIGFIYLIKLSSLLRT
jgi:hypothetical protein